MLSWAIQITIISIVLIFLVHHLINFFKSTLTVPKIKDLVNMPTQKYENIFSQNDYTLIDLLPKKDETNMKSELKNFLKSQLKNSNTNDGTDILALESTSNSYSNF